jgi:hypothetical protein
VGESLISSALTARSIRISFSQKELAAFYKAENHIAMIWSVVHYDNATQGFNYKTDLMPFFILPFRTLPRNSNFMQTKQSKKSWGYPSSIQP